METEKVEPQTEKQQEEPRSKCFLAVKEAVEQVCDIYKQTIDRHCPGLLKAERELYNERDPFVELSHDFINCTLIGYEMGEELCKKGRITPEKAKRSVLKALKDYFEGRANHWKKKLMETEYKMACTPKRSSTFIGLEIERDMYSKLYSISKQTAMQLCGMLREPYREKKVRMPFLAPIRSRINKAVNYIKLLTDP
jgi:hypothetical protein